MTAHIHWEFTERRDKQIADEKLKNMAEVIALALDGAPSAYGFPYGDNDVIYYVSPPKQFDAYDFAPSDSEPA